MKDPITTCGLCKQEIGDFKTCMKCMVCACNACVEAGKCCETKERKAMEVKIRNVIGKGDIVYTSEDVTKTMAQNALGCQDAVNLGGVIHSFDKVVSELQVWARLPGRGTGWVNCHPIVAMYMEKFAHLNGATYEHPQSAAIYLLVSEAADRKNMILPEEELRDAHEGQGTVLSFENWLKEMAENPTGTLQEAAKKLLSRHG